MKCLPALKEEEFDLVRRALNAWGWYREQTNAPDHQDAYDLAERLRLLTVDVSVYRNTPNSCTRCQAPLEKYEGNRLMPEKGRWETLCVGCWEKAVRPIEGGETLNTEGADG